MYGMIHQAARAMTLEHLGEGVWADVLNASGLDEAHFVSAQAYPDEQTLALVGAVAERASLSLEDALRAFGRYWIKFTDRSSYNALMRMSGDTMQEFVANLDRMHGAIQTAMPEARMPSFRVTASTADRIEFEYLSDRAGLEPFVRGLLEGLMDRFAQPGVIFCAQRADRAHFIIEFANTARG